MRARVSGLEQTACCAHGYAACSLPRPSDPRAFENFLNGAGALANRHAQTEVYGWHTRKLDFERHFCALVLLHVTHYASDRDLTWVVEEDLLFEALQADFDISVSGFGDAMAESSPSTPQNVLRRRSRAEAAISA